MLQKQLQGAAQQRSCNSSSSTCCSCTRSVCSPMPPASSCLNFTWHALSSSTPFHPSFTVSLRPHAPVAPCIALFCPLRASAHVPRHKRKLLTAAAVGAAGAAAAYYWWYSAEEQEEQLRWAVLYCGQQRQVDGRVMQVVCRQAGEQVGRRSSCERHGAGCAGGKGKSTAGRTSSEGRVEAGL
jgi:hypothetical protein